MIGQRTSRLDILGKLDGTARYTADVSYPGMLHGAVVRAPVAHGRIKSIRRVEGAGVDWSRVVFATAADIPGKNRVKMIAEDMPFLADGEVLYKGEPVALVAAATIEEAEAARRAVVIEMESLPNMLTLKELVAQHRADPSKLHTLSRWNITKGDVAAALASAPIVLEDCYSTPHQEQGYIETNAVIAVPEGEGKMRVEGSLQCPYYVAPAVAQMLGTDLDHLHVRVLTVGGAFGGKEDFPSLLSGHAALLAHISGKPVRIILDRAEDIAYTTKRHPSWMRVRAGANKDGLLLGLEAEIIFDGGAYITMSPVVLSRGAIHASGPYVWPAVRIDAMAYRTNTPPNGAFRGFGVPQTIFPIESHMDRLAAACGLEPQEFRRRNRLKVGDVTATSQTLRDSVATQEVLDEAMARTDFVNKRRRLSEATKIDEKNHLARGIGLAFYWHGAGFTGAGESRISGKMAVDLAEDGKAHVRVSSTEMGQGSHTVLAQVVAEDLGVPLSNVVCDETDTARVPNSGPTVASRTTMIVGWVLHECAVKARQKLFNSIASRYGLAEAELHIDAAGVIFCGSRRLGTFAEEVKKSLAAEKQPRWIFEIQQSLPPHVKWDEPTHKGDAYVAFAWACTVAEVEVDLDTYEINVPSITTVADVGRAVNPTLAEGQIEGGILQSVGWALTEEVGVRPDGGLLRDRFQTYIMPTSVDAPQNKVYMLEHGYERGPGGAKGIGELPMSGGGPAIANALEHALGVRLKDLPLTPEKIYAAFSEKKAQEKAPKAQEKAPKAQEKAS